MVPPQTVPKLLGSLTFSDHRQSNGRLSLLPTNAKQYGPTTTELWPKIVACVNWEGVSPG
jgi:hypothetical protein